MSRRPGAGARTLLLATGNRGKLRELAEMLATFALELRSLADFPGVTLPPEGDDTWRTPPPRRPARRRCGLALGDDSTEVAALGGAPAPLGALRRPGLGDAGRSAHLLAASRERAAATAARRFVCVADARAAWRRAGARPRRVPWPSSPTRAVPPEPRLRPGVPARRLRRLDGGAAGRAEEPHLAPGRAVAALGAALGALGAA
jgi:hypothetical protein